MAANETDLEDAHESSVVRGSINVFGLLDLIVTPTETVMSDEGHRGLS